MSAIKGTKVAKQDASTLKASDDSRYGTTQDALSNQAGAGGGWAKEDEEKARAKRIDASDSVTDETLMETKEDPFASVYPEGQYGHIDEQKVENETHAGEVGHAGYKLSAPQDLVDKSEKGSGKMLSVKLLKAYVPLSTDNYKVNGRKPAAKGKSQVERVVHGRITERETAEPIADKIPAGVSVSLPADEAERAIKLGIAEAPAGYKGERP